MIHSSHYSPVIHPILADISSTQIDRVQDLTSSIALNRTKVREVGRDGIVDFRAAVPSVNVNMKQYEYGNLSLFRKLANKGDTVTTIQSTDFTSPTFDIAGYTTDDSGTFLGTIWYPGLRLSSFNLAIGNPQAMSERNFTFVGENEVALLNNNKYLNRNRGTILTGGLNKTLTISLPSPVADPDNSGKFLERVIRVRAGTATELTWGTDWSYDGVSTLTINGTSNAGDVIWYWYTAGSYLSGQTPFTNNDSDLCCIGAEAVSIYLTSSQYVYRLQSVNIDCTFDREDIREIGNLNIVARGVRDRNVNITLGRILEAYTIEEISRGVAGQSFGKIDPNKYLDNFSLVVKFYSDFTKHTFKLGYKFINLTPSNRDSNTPTSDYINAGVQFAGQDWFVTNDNSVL